MKGRLLSRIDPLLPERRESLCPVSRSPFPPSAAPSSVGILLRGHLRRLDVPFLVLADQLEHNLFNIHSGSEQC